MAPRIELDKIQWRPRGKNSRTKYYLRYYGAIALAPEGWLMRRRERLLEGWERRPDAAEIRERVNFCCPIREPFGLDASARSIASLRWAHSNYCRDGYEALRHFPHAWRFNAAFGDNCLEPPAPAFTKSRPVLAEGGSSNCALLKLNKVRHFIFLKDPQPFREKRDDAIFRGASYQAHRKRFLEMWHGHPLVDCADTAKRPDPAHPQWHGRPITLWEHLRHKFVVSLEGNDVASNLKWVMSSNSAAIMPRPKYETWFMEGRLKPGVHFIPIRDDYSDLQEQIRWFTAHPDAAEEIIRNAHAWVERFLDPERELIISLLVAQRYFELLRA